MTTIFFGDWMELRATLAKIESDEAVDGAVDQLERIGKSIQRKIRAHVRNQDLDWAPLQSDTIRKKGFAKVYMRRGDYIRSIKVEVDRRENGAELRVYPEGDHYSGLDMQTLADYLEYGTKNIQARPLWRPVYAELDSMRATKKILKEFGSVVFKGMA